MYVLKEAGDALIVRVKGALGEALRGVRLNSDKRGLQMVSLIPCK